MKHDYDDEDEEEALLKQKQRNSKNIYHRISTTFHDTWIHHYTPETMQKNLQEKLWDFHGVVFMNYLEGHKITGKYMDELKDVIQVSLPHLTKKKVLFHQYKTSAYRSRDVDTKLHDIRN